MISKFIIEKTIEEAKKSNHTHKIGACIFHKKAIISLGRNHPFQSVKHLHPRFTKWPTSIHAEIDSILKARRPVQGCSMLIIRINKQGRLMLAKPCKHCLSYIVYTGIGFKNIYYTNNSGEIERLDDTYQNILEVKSK